jgi:hypothetical protein
MFLIILGLSIGTYLSIAEYLRLKADPTSEDEMKFKFENIYNLSYLGKLTDTWLIISIVSSVILVVVLLIFLFLRKRIAFAAELIREVSKAIKVLPLALVWPIIPFILQLCVLFYCGSVGLYMASAGVEQFKIIDISLGQMVPAKIEGDYQVGDYCIPLNFKQYKEEFINNITDLHDIDCVFYRFGYNTTLPSIKGLNLQFAEKYYATAINFLNKYQFIPQVKSLFLMFF